MANKIANRDGGMTSEEGLSRIASNLYTREGVVGDNDLLVAAAGTPDNTVRIPTGSIIIGENSPSSTTPDYFYYGWVTSEVSVTITANASGNPRIDLIVAYVDLSVVSSSSNDNPGALAFAAVAGTPAATPSAPTASAVTTAIGAANPYVILAQVSVANGFATITNGNITDMRPHVDTPKRRADYMAGDFVATGMTVAATSGLGVAIAAGEAYINGKLIYKPRITKTLTASRDVYIDLPQTALPTNTDDYTYTEVANGAAAPALATNSIRIAKVVTAAASITSVTQNGANDANGNPIYPSKPIGYNQLTTRYALGTITAATLGTTGNKAVTGLGFRPRLVRFTLAPSATGTTATTASGGMTDSAQWYTTAAASNAPAASRNSSSAACIGYVSAGSSTPILLASRQSMDQDGFTINVSTASSNFDVIYEAFG